MRRLQGNQERLWLPRPTARAGVLSPRRMWQFAVLELIAKEIKYLWLLSLASRFKPR